MSEPEIRKIIHVDMDAFYASVEQRDNPEYRGRPVVVGGPPEKRGVVAAASYEARKFGIRSAMSSHQAIRRCPDLIFLPPRFEVYKAISQQIHRIFEEYTHLIEPLSLDEAYLDVTQNRRNLSSATRIATEIRQRIYEETQLTASAGVSYNKFLAKIASDVNKPDGLFVLPPHQAQAFIRTLPVGKFYGVGKVTAARMNQCGIFTGQDLLAWSLEELVGHFGKMGHYFYQVARGYDDRPVSTMRERKSVGSEHTFPQDLTQLLDMEAALDFLADDLLEWMGTRQILGRTLTLKVKYADFKQVTRSRTTDPPLTEKAGIVATAKALLLQTEAGAKPVRLLGLSFSNLLTADEYKVAQKGVLPCQLRLPLG